MSIFLVALLSVTTQVTAQTPETPSRAESTQPNSTSAKSPHEVRRAISAALRAEATAADGGTHAEAVRELCELFHEVRTQADMSEKSRIQWTAKVRSRLLRVQKRIETRDQRVLDFGEAGTSSQLVKRSTELVSVTISKSVAGSKSKDCVSSPESVTEAVLSKLAVSSPGSSGGRAVPADDGQDLVELIQATISPEIWDVNGGAASIYYFRPLHALVVRAPGGVHGQSADALKQLRAVAAP